MNAGLLASAANRIGVSVEVYREMREAGQRWCSFHQQWEPASDFVRRLTWPHRLQDSCPEGNRERSRAGMARLYARRKAER
jgi:hypothetical protein